MVDQKDYSGQVILTSAILLAIILIIISLMLNNVIYATNVAYIGFMDGSKYEDISIRQLTAKESQRSYADDSGLTNLYMIDYAKQLNLLTNSKGKYVEIEAITPLPTDALTAWNLYISDKDSAGKYSILLKDPYVTSTVPTQTTAVFDASTKTVTEGGTVTLNIILSPTIDQPVEVSYAVTAGGTATAADLSGTTSGTLTFAANSNGGPVTITTAQDTTYEGTETFLVTLAPVTTNVVAGTPSTVTVNIMDDDSPSSGSTQYDMEFTSFDATRPDSDKKDVHLTAVLKNTGTSALTNVVLTLTYTPTTKTITSGTNPVTIGNLAPGSSATYTWVITTQNQNDKITSALVKATAAEAGPESSPQLSNV